MRPWLFQIAHNTAIDLVVRRRELPTDQVPEIATRDAEPLAGALVTALAALPERQRRVYVMRELHGMRIAEAAAELGLTSTQIEQALFAARNRLAELLVFGERLDCVTVRRLVAGPLDHSERRALKTHLRSCPQCRRAVPLRSRAPVWLPGPAFEWLRGVLVGGAAPAAAKVGAVVATATLAAGSVPVVSHQLERNPVARHASVQADATSSTARKRAVRATPIVLRTPARATAAIMAPVRLAVVPPARNSPEHASTAHESTGARPADHRESETHPGSGSSEEIPVTPKVEASGGTSGEHDGHGGDAVTTSPTSTVAAAGEDRTSDGGGDSTHDAGSDGGSHDGGGSGDGGTAPPTTTTPAATTTAPATTTTVAAPVTTTTDG
jgi:hypothetical protein